MPAFDVNTPEWWRERLGKKLDARRQQMQTLQDYYDGRHPLAFASERFREAFSGRLRAFSDNFCPLVVEAVEERLTVQGFRLGGGQDAKADQDAWRIWQTNRLDAKSLLAHRESLVKGCAYVIVSPFLADMRDPETPLITIEDPLEVAVDEDPGSGERRAALKRWIDDDGLLRAVLWLPGELYRWRSAAKYRGAATDNIRWEEFALPEDGVGGFPIRLQTKGGRPFDDVPVIAFPNRPLRDGTFESEIATILPAQDAINKTAADMLVASEFAAFRQRYILNLDLELDENTGKPRVPFKVGADQLLILGPPDRTDDPNTPPVQVGSWDISPLDPYISAIEMWVQHIATRTRTPGHYLLGQTGAKFPSGDSLKGTETGLVAKVREKMVTYGEGWEEVIRLAFAILDDERANVVDSEVIWRDPESRTEAEHIDALLKLKSLDVPVEQLWEDAGYSPQQIERFQAILAAKPAPPPPTIVVGGPQPAIPGLTAAGGGVP